MGVFHHVFDIPYGISGVFARAEPVGSDINRVGAVIYCGNGRIFIERGS